MAKRGEIEQPAGIIEALRRLRVPHEKIAEAIGRGRPTATKLVNGERQIQPDEIGPLMQLISETLQEIEPLIPARSVSPPAAPTQTLDHQLIDLMKSADLDDAEREAIWTVIRYLTRTKKGG